MGDCNWECSGRFSYIKDGNEMRNFGNNYVRNWGSSLIPTHGSGPPTAQELRDWAVNSANAERTAQGLDPLDSATQAGADEWVGKVNRGEMTVLGMATEFVKGLNDSAAPNTAAQLQQMIQDGVFSPVSAATSPVVAPNSGRGNVGVNGNGGDLLIPPIPNWVLYAGAGLVTLGGAVWIMKKLR